MGRQPYTFENFIISSSNQRAYQACKAVVESKERNHPFLLWGPNGCGKSHLLFAMKKRFEAQNKRVCYTTGEELLYHLLTSLKQTKASFEFRRRYCRFDVVLVDNCQFLLGRPSAQQEILLLAERMEREGGILVMASDRSAHEFGWMEQEIKSRFKKGQIANISVPDFELRCRYLKHLCKTEGILMSEETIEAVVERDATNLPALKGFFNTLCFCLGDTALKEVDIPWLNTHIFKKES